jgi:hypothetical protein
MKYSIALIAVAALCAAGPALATTNDECKAKIGTLKTMTDTAEYKNPKDLSMLQLKLDEAVLKLGVSKLADASRKISDYTSKLTQLNSSQGKITFEVDVTYSDFMNAAKGVQDCIATIG